ncbi:MAG: hypothetical protein JRD68_00130 [Deltaproteobacteria bacterium]|nr:hypothetical protein [Deltaproteobacteria bacterium]
MGSITTYHSDGNGALPGGGNPTYSSLVTWEDATTGDQSGQGLVELTCYYKNGGHNDGDVDVADSTNTDSTNRRIIRSATTDDTPSIGGDAFAGKANTGADFVYTLDAGRWVIRLSEEYSRIENLGMKATQNNIFNDSILHLEGDHTQAINFVIRDSANAGDGSCKGARINAVTALCYQGIVYNVDSEGFLESAGTTSGFICCTAVGNGGMGFYADRDIYCWSCYGANNITADFRDDSARWLTGSGWNASKDTTSDLGGKTTNNKNSNDLITGGELDGDYLATQSINWAGGAGDNAGKSPFGTFEAINDFDGFFNGDSPDPLALFDIAGNARPAGDDVAWDVGASQYVAAGGLSIPLVNAGLINRGLVNGGLVN